MDFSNIIFFIKQFYQQHKKLCKKLLLYFIILIFCILLHNTSFGYEYNSSNYVEWYDTQKGKTYRVCSDNALILIPKQSNRTALDALYIYNGDYASITVYENGVQKSDGSGSWFMSNTDLNKGITPTFSHKGDYIAFKYDSSMNSVYEVSQSFSPFITNTAEIPSYTFTDLKINIANLSAVLSGNHLINSFELVIQHNGTNYTYDINDYIHSYSLAGNINVTGYHRFTIPKYDILNNVTLQENDILRFYIKHITKNVQNPSQVITDTYNLGSFNMTLSGDSLINNNMNSLNNSIHETTNAVQKTTQAVEDNTQAVENLENTITNSSVSDDSLDLPTLDIQNPAQQGIETIFLQMYDAFCTDLASDIVIPVPNTNQSFTIPYTLTYDALHNNGGDIIISIITAFWWYRLAGYVAYDIFDKMTKIQSGDAEEVQTKNISQQML